MKTTNKLNEGIRVAKEGIEECWDDMGGQTMTTGENGEQMSVTISMPGKNISVTTDSAEEIGNILRLAGINIGGGTAGDVDGDGDHDLGDHAAELSLPGAGGEEPVIYVGAGEGGGGEQQYGDQPSNSPLTTNAGNTAGEEASSDDAEEEEKDETKEATQTPKSWEDMSGNEHPGTSVKGDRYGNQDDKEEEKDKPTSMYKKNAIIDKEVDESFEELDEESARILELAGVTNPGILDEGIMDKLKSLALPKLMKLLGPDAEQIASAIKQATGGDLTPSKENAMKVVQALGLDKAAEQGQSPQMAEDRTAAIAGNWQGKLHQALYTMGLLGSAGAASAMYGTVSGSWFATVGVLLLMFAGTFFGTAPGQIGAMGNFGNKGTSMQKGLDDHGMPIRNTNVESVEENDLNRMLEMAGITNEAQSAAQKAAFKAMIAKKNGGKSDAKADDKEDDNKKPDDDGDGIPDWADKDKEVKEEAPANNSIYGQSVYEAGTESARILALSGIEEGKLMNSPSNTSMPEPKTYDSLPSKVGVGAGHKDYGQNRANNQGENPMGMHTPDIDSIEEAFTTAMGEYRKFVAENISRKK